MLDYAFYSLYKLYLLKEGKNSNPVYSATMAIAALQVVFLLGFGILSAPFYNGSLSENLGIDKITLQITLLVLGLIYSVYLYRSYKKRLPKIVKRYNNDSKNKWFKPWMLYFLALSFILIPVFLIDLIKVFI